MTQLILFSLKDSSLPESTVSQRASIVEKLIVRSVPVVSKRQAD
jgi:hypothetical protein